ncbi:sugar transferase [Carboxydochorda subterranea]|uniref:Sugar transferase n=1 Tax=Carboxydichorda subterranea TaxID=3109565 RepID=A0ABZ1C4B9_9FIRM|nr:sugar transferase [Limnochorda sp. L945t]WRP18823.1 sugar transferase [Limnochorda sp. L945t]
MGRLQRSGKLNGEPKGWLGTLLSSWHADLLGSLVLGGVSYFLALWIRWGGHVPSHLWQPVGYAASAGLLGLVIGGSLVDLWGRHRSWAAVSYSAFLASSFSILFAMASVYALRVVAIPRLTFALAVGLLWGCLVLWQWILLRIKAAWSADAVSTSMDIREQGLGDHVTELTHLLSGDKPLNGNVVVLPGARELLLASSRFYEDGDHLLLEIRPRACQWPAPALKRMIDVLLSSFGLVLTSPVWILAALAVRLDTPGPVLFQQARVGQGGRIFEILKFRTMVDHAEDDTGPVLASRDDPRVTRVGRWLRTFRIDELPQLLNVLRGDMSLIGPRPERPEFVKHYREEIEGYDLRHLVKPGITGLAQIRGRYDTAAEDKLRFDLAYIFLWSPLLDLKIILQTIEVMLTPERARGVTRKTPSAPAARTANSVPSGVPNAQGSTGLEV